MHRKLALFIGLSFVVLCATAAEPPDRLNYQGVLRDASDNPLNGSYDMVFRFFVGATPNELMVDEHLAAGTGAVTVDNGLFSVALGSGNVIDGSGLGSFTSLTQVFTGFFEPIHLEVEVAGEVLSPRIEIASAGHALNAANASQLDGLDNVQFLRSDVSDFVNGALFFRASPVGSNVCSGSACVDPASAGADQTLFGVGVNGTERFRVDAEGDAAVQGALNTVGNADIGGALTTTGNVDVGGLLTTQSDVAVNGNLSIQSGGLSFPDGSLQTSASLARNVISTLDAEGATGAEGSLAIGADGNPIVSYKTYSTNDLKVVHCVDRSCGGAAITTVDDVGDVGEGSSIAIGTDGNPIISYFDDTNDDLKVAHCTDPGCNGASITAIDTVGSVGWYTSIAIGTDGNPVIGYFDDTNVAVKVARCNDSSCTGATLNTIDSPYFITSISLAIGSDGNPVMSFFDITNQTVKVAYCTDASCGGATVNPIAVLTNASAYSSITIGTDGNPLVSYSSGTDLHVAHCTSVSCFVSGVAVVDTLVVNDFSSISIAIGAGGKPVIGYDDRANLDLKVAHCTNTDCSDASLSTVDASGETGRFASLAIGSDGHPVIAYYDSTNADLKIVTQLAGQVGQAGGGPVAPPAPTNPGEMGRPPLQRMNLSPSTAPPSGETDWSPSPGAAEFRPAQRDRSDRVPAIGLVEPGDVLAIDSDQPEFASRARRPADSAVLGIAVEDVAEESPTPRADGEVPADARDVPIAASGIVICKVDAAFGAIRPGDLLTTSPTPGHAMRATEAIPGTIFAKALEPLDHGTGLIRVMVWQR